MITCLALKWVSNLRYRWSRFRHRNSPKTSFLRQDLIPQNFSDIQRTAKELYKHFEYTLDDITRLYDSVDTPASCWNRAFTERLKDDCDGFHSALYWAVSQRFDCYLLTLVTKDIINSHSLLVVNYNGKKYFVDYTHVSNAYEGLRTLIKGVVKYRRMPEIIIAEGSGFEDSWYSLFTIKGRVIYEKSD